jgi:polyphosphate kinase 2 (PPK2 family)
MKSGLVISGDGCGGKGSAIRQVMSGGSPQDCQVCSFKHTSASELEQN